MFEEHLSIWNWMVELLQSVAVDISETSWGVDPSLSVDCRIYDHTQEDQWV